MAQLTVVGDPTSTASLRRLALEVAPMMSEWTSATLATEIPPRGPVFIARGDSEERAALIASVDPSRLATLVHPTASVSPSAQLGRNVMISAQVVVMMDAVVGDGVVTSSLSSIEHDNTIGTMTFMGTGAVLCGGVTTGDYAFIGGGAVIKPGVTIGDRCTVGTGAVVINDTEPGSTVVGNPARPL